MATTRKTRDLCQTCWQDANAGAYFPNGNRWGTCAACGEDTFVSRSSALCPVIGWNGRQCDAGAGHDGPHGTGGNPEATRTERAAIAALVNLAEMNAPSLTDAGVAQLAAHAIPEVAAVGTAELARRAGTPRAFGPFGVDDAGHSFGGHVHASRAEERICEAEAEDAPALLNPDGTPTDYTLAMFGRAVERDLLNARDEDPDGSTR